MEKREKFSSRLGFILISAGCAIGLGNVWRFPYITGVYGGAAFVLIYLFFLLILGIPIMAMEFSIGRASKKSVALSFDVLEPKGTKWHLFKWFGMAGNYLLMMFYTTVSGWMLAYLFKMAMGNFSGKTPDEIGQAFDGLLGSPVEMIIWVVIVCIIGFLVCSLGLNNGVEKITKTMMIFLLVVMVILVFRSVTLPNSGEGLAFYLVPNFGKLVENGVWNTIYAAMGQAFFTLSIGMGSMAIFGSYIGDDRRLFGESINITILDTSVAIMAGLIIFPACFAYGVNPGSGPGLVFVTLPNIFNSMPLGRLWGSLFFLFMNFASISTVIAVFENIMSFAMDLTGCSRKKAAIYNFIAIIILSLPCILGFNVLSGFQPFGEGSVVLDLEDFIVSNNILPIGSLIYVLFCVTRYGFGWEKFVNEVNKGKGMKFPTQFKFYFTFILPIIIVIIFIFGYITKFIIKS